MHGSERQHRRGHQSGAGPRRVRRFGNHRQAQREVKMLRPDQGRCSTAAGSALVSVPTGYGELAVYHSRNLPSSSSRNAAILSQAD